MSNAAFVEREKINPTTAMEVRWGALQKCPALGIVLIQSQSGGKNTKRETERERDIMRFHL